MPVGALPMARTLPQLLGAGSSSGYPSTSACLVQRDASRRTEGASGCDSDLTVSVMAHA